MDNKLEDLITEHKIESFLDKVMKKHLGVTVEEIKKDISNKLIHSLIEDINIDFDLDFKTSKKKFKNDFIKKQLLLERGNVSNVAKTLNIDRRSVHRHLNKEFTSKIRSDLIKPYTIKQREIEMIIKNTLTNYNKIINKEYLEQMYCDSKNISKKIIQLVPPRTITLKEAEAIFEKKYITKKLEDNYDDVMKTSKDIKIRYETLLRKLKKYNITFNPLFMKDPKDVETESYGNYQ